MAKHIKPVLLLAPFLAILLGACSSRYDQAEEERRLQATINAYHDRVMTLATAYASSQESAPDAAEAAIAGAIKEYRAMEDQTVRWHAITYRDGHLDSDQGYRLAADCRERYRADALTLIMELRVTEKAGRKGF